ncbi:DUF6934 family protein [Mucilaginibacter sp. SJ]|uniref:DUF6934 family protein n=1 Tax=Mucilaginibacter sp. SJ TaxID=3029053 RepID=UPI0023A9FA1A|nr:hypothetical protein [Mucilaginibacter sp. SJ]WEA03774.1 hypothetical protein MusilaSJ_12600 [Mucilaginibacter sp. SJ]
MNLERYKYFTNDYRAYEFYSEGPKGRIKKAVVYSKIQNNPTVYNLAFGDEDVVTGKIIDSIVSNNKDRDIVLATVAATIIAFSERYGNHFIYATGSSQSRTRLYQISINMLWSEIEEDFIVFGFRDGDWHEFQKNINYEAFLVKRK